MRGSKHRKVAVAAESEMEDLEDNADQTTSFFACYLLSSMCPRFKGHTYIGFTVNPRRRIRQHNGEIKCGAWRTKSKRPWEMVLCIHGFPSKVSALQFEWAWQHPCESKAVRAAASSFKSLSGLTNKIKLAFTMLNLTQWERFNLSLNFFSTKHAAQSAHCPKLPKHMKTTILPMDDLPCYSENTNVDADDDVLEEREIHVQAPNAQEETSWTEMHDEDYDIGEDYYHPHERRKDHPKSMESDKAELTSSSIHEDGSTLEDHDLEETGVQVQPAWRGTYDEGCHLVEDYYHDLIATKDHPKTMESDKDGPGVIRIHEEGYTLEQVHDNDHDHNQEESEFCVFKGRTDRTRILESDKHEPTLRSIHDDGSAEKDHDHDLEEKQDHILDYDYWRDDDYQKTGNYIHERVSDCHLENWESTLTDCVDLGQGGTSLLEAIDLSTPQSCRLGWRKRKSSICLEIIDLTDSPA
ncbi:uncharacterized protein LOC144706352 [Wolffia australiana]